MISQRTIEEVKERANLLELVGESVKLRRAGTNYVGLCPFHAEKSGSFNIRDNGHFYHCFGCGASGNAITYTMETKGLSFPDAVEELAARFGVRVEHEGGTKERLAQPDREKFYKLNHLAHEFFLREFASAPPQVRAYLHERGVTEQSLQEFGVGFAPTDRNKLILQLKKQGAPEELLISGGLARRSERGELYDTFRARIIFPIFVERRKIAGFGGRILASLVSPETAAAAPKYLNSPETPVYEKHKTLFALPHALEAVRKSRELYVVEGYMDVIGLWQAGVKNAVATCGTAVTENHARRLSHLVQRVKLLFDGDSAGQNAAGKSYPVFINSGIDCAAVFLPDGEDPDTIALKQGEKTGEFLCGLRRAPLFECYIDYLIRKNGLGETRDMGAAAKGKIAQEVAENLQRVKNGIERSELIERAALKLRIDVSAMRDLCAGVKKTDLPEAPLPNLKADDVSAPLVRKAVPELPSLDRDILMAVMLKRAELPERILHNGPLCELLDPSTRSFVVGMAEVFSLPSEELQKRAAARLLAQFGESWKAFWINAHAIQSRGDVKVDELFAGCLASIERIKKNQQIKEVERRLKEAPDEATKIELAQRLIELRRAAQAPAHAQ